MARESNTCAAMIVINLLKIVNKHSHDENNVKIRQGDLQRLKERLQELKNFQSGKEKDTRTLFTNHAFEIKWCSERIVTLENELDEQTKRLTKDKKLIEDFIQMNPRILQSLKG